jgi:arylsulfatase A
MFDWSGPITGGPTAAGFDYYFGDDVPNFPPFLFIENEKATCEPVDINESDLECIGRRGGIHGSGPGEEGWTFEQVMPELTRRAVDYIRCRSKEDQPYFLYFSPTSPHTPVVPTREFQGSSEAGTYGDFVIQTDDAVGRIIQALKESGTYTNTLLIVTSDNGPSHYHRGLIESHQHYPAGHLRGMKSDTLEGGHRIPFIASWPKGGVMGGKRIDVLLSLTDLFATTAHIIGVPVEAGAAEDSLNMLPCLRRNQPVRTEMVYHSGRGALGLRQDEWVYLQEGGVLKEEPNWYKEQFGVVPTDSKELLFNLATDPGQKKNLYHRFPERVKAMKQRLTEIKK